MFSTGHDFFRALAQARKATRRGDVATTERWIKCAERHLAIAERIENALARQERQRRQGPERNPWVEEHG
jgi:hypothetical protein